MGFSSTGFTKPTIEEIVAEINADLLALVSSTLDLAPDQPLGQIVGIFAQREAVLWEGLETACNAINPAAAENFLLDFLCALTGTTRNPAKKSTVTLNCNVNNLFSAPAGTMMANVTGQPTIRFVNKSDTGSLTPAGVYPIVFESVDFGSVAANAGTLTTITTPVSGWNSCTNPLDATLGNVEEVDADLAVRREAELAAPGACTVDSLRADLLQVKGVQQAFVFENETLVTDSNGVPGKAFEAVVYDGVTPQAANLDVATAVWNGKPSGAETHGSIATSVVDSTGTTRTVNWSRTTVEQVWLEFDLEIDTALFPAAGPTLVKAAVAAWGKANLNLGIGVVAKKLDAQALSVPGVIDVTALRLGFAPSPVGTANLVITNRQIASLDTSRMIVNTTPGSESSP